jgi:hypothetical protein
MAALGHVHQRLEMMREVACLAVVLAGMNLVGAGAANALRAFDPDFQPLEDLLAVPVEGKGVPVLPQQDKVFNCRGNGVDRGRGDRPARAMSPTAPTPLHTSTLPPPSDARGRDREAPDTSAVRP